MKDYNRGLKSGVPIGLGYLSVSFTFGILAVSYGFEWWQAVLISMTTLTSAGQLAGINIMLNPASYIEMLISQLTINVRYSFMSISLSQKTSPQFKGIRRWLFGFFMTDEIFAVAVSEKEVSTKFFAGLTVFPYIGWTLGTLLGAVLGNILPEMIMNALCLAIYGMFIAIVAPKAKESIKLFAVVMVSIALSFAFYYTPVINSLSSGLSICICAIVAAVFGALTFPKKEDTANE
ncbi:MAG: AzlC family ABC transporter permease [Clostridia bacterium]|nr:AzlC family ABC transporter permease [Clostridia bacterium]